MEITFKNTMETLSRVGGNIDVYMNLCLVRFDVEQVAVGRYVLLDTADYTVKTAGEVEVCRAYKKLSGE